MTAPVRCANYMVDLIMIIEHIIHYLAVDIILDQINAHVIQ